MAKKSDTWMAFYVGDYTANTLHLTRAQHGSYLLLILAAFKNGGWLPNDDARLASIGKMTPKEWAAERDLLAEFFNVTPERWTHGRVEMELKKAADLTAKRQQAGNASAAKRQQTGNTCSTHVATNRQQTGSKPATHVAANRQQTARPSQSESESESESDQVTTTESKITNTESVCDNARKRASHSRLITGEWQPSGAEIAKLRRGRPDLVGELYEHRMQDFREWCRANAITSHDFEATWSGFMRKTKASVAPIQRKSDPTRHADPAWAGVDY